MQAYFKYTAFTGIILILAGLLFSPALQSIGCALVILHPFLTGNATKILPAFRNNKLLWLLPVYYLITFISILYTDDYKAFWNQNALLKLPFVLLPIGLANGGGLSKKQLNIIMYFFIGIIWLVALATFFNYLAHFKEINEQIKHSKPIPIFTATKKELSHIYFGIMLAFATCASFYFAWINKPASKVRKWLIRSIFFTFLICIHSIIARTGLLAIYASAFIVLSWFIIKEKKLLLGSGILAAFIVLLTVSVLFVPSLRNRLANTQKDISQYQEGKELNHYSISMRMESLKTAWKVYKNSPIIGVGAADIIAEMHKQYEADNSPLTEENRKLPHNQFLQTLTMLGIAGLASLLAIFLYPVYKRNYLLTYNNMQLLFLLFIVICFFSFQVESVLERQVGVTFFSLFYILLGHVIPQKANSIS